MIAASTAAIVQLRKCQTCYGARHCQSFLSVTLAQRSASQTTGAPFLAGVSSPLSRIRSLSQGINESKQSLSTGQFLCNRAAAVFSKDSVSSSSSSSSPPSLIVPRFELAHSHRAASSGTHPFTTYPPHHHSHHFVRYFSTTLLNQTPRDEHKKEKANSSKDSSTQPPQPKSSKRLSPAEQRRRRRYRLIQRQKRLRRDQQQHDQVEQQPAISAPPPPPFGPKRTESEMQALFEELARNYPVSQVKETLGKLDQQMDAIHQASNDPTNKKKKNKKNPASQRAAVSSHAAHVRNLLRTANTNNPLQIRLLEFLLRTTRPLSKQQQKKQQQQQQQHAPKQQSPPPNSSTSASTAALKRENIFPGAVEALMQARFYYHEQLKQQQQQRQQQEQQQQLGANESSTVFGSKLGLADVNHDDDSTVSENDQVATDHRERHAEEEAQLLLELLIGSVPPKTLVTVMEVFQYLVQKMKEKREVAMNGEQRRDDITLALHPDDDHEGVTGSNNISDERDSKNGDWRKKKKRKKREEDLLHRLHRHLKRRSGPHYALFADRVTLFFDLSRPKTSQALSVHADNSGLAKAKLDWDAYRQSFCRKLMTIQEKMDLRPKKEKIDDQPENDALSIDIDRYEEESIVEEHVDGESDSKTKDQDENENEVNDALNELEHHLNLSSLSPLLKNAEKKTKKARGMHAIYEAKVLNEFPFSSPQSSLASTDSSDTVIVPPPARTTVFLENLPIDMTELRLTELYSRCGDIASVKIFNQRPDLDPGPLSASQKRERRRQHVRSISMRRKRRWNPPRTPVYGLITFEDEQGYGRCVNDTLRIFGMLIEKHPVRSIQASDMRKLFIEGIPAGEFTSTDFETKLYHVLQPYISLNSDFAGMGHGSHQRRKSIHSCEIKFPSFEVAFQSYHKLMLDLDMIRNIDDCTVQWLRTPRDAELWWTRRRGFD